MVEADVATTETYDRAFARAELVTDDAKMAFPSQSAIVISRDREEFVQNGSFGKTCYDRPCHGDGREIVAGRNVGICCFIRQPAVGTGPVELWNAFDFLIGYFVIVNIPLDHSMD